MLDWLHRDRRGRRPLRGLSWIVLAVFAALLTPIVHVGPAAATDGPLDTSFDLEYRAFTIFCETVPEARGIWSDGTTLWIDYSDHLTDTDDFIRAYRMADMARDPAKDITKVRAAYRSGFGIWSDGSTMWAIDGSYRDTIYAYDLATGERQPDDDIDTLTAAGNGSPSGMWSDGSTVWVADEWDEKIYAYDLATGARRADNDINGLVDGVEWADWRDYEGNWVPHSLWSDGATMWVGDSLARKIFAYDLATGVRRPAQDFDNLVDAGIREPDGIWSDGTSMWVLDSFNNKAFAFDMPERTSLDSALGSLEVTGVDIGSFLPGRLDFAAFVPSATASTTVTAVPLHADATAVISADDADPDTAGHQVDLAEGANTFTVTVTNGAETTTYTVVVTRVDTATLTANAALESLTVSGSDRELLNGARTESVANVANDVAVTTVAVAPSDTYAVVDISPADADPVADGHQVKLVVGTNKFAVKVRSTDGTGAKTYTVTANRASAAPFGWNSVRDIPLDSVGSSPTGIWSDGTTMWVARYHGNKVQAYDLATGARQQGRDFSTLTGNGGIGAGNGGIGGIWSDGTTMWVTDNQDDKVYAFVLATGAREPGSDIGTLGSRGNHDPRGLWSDGDTMWVADWRDGKVYAYERATGAHLPGKDLNALGAAGNTDADGLWSDGTTMWVFDDLDDKIYAYDLASRVRRNALEFENPRVPGSRSRPGFSRDRAKNLWSDGDIMWASGGRYSNRLDAFNMPVSAVLSSLQLAEIDIGSSPADISRRLSFAVSVPAATTSVTVVAVPAFPEAVVAVSPEDADAGTEGHQVSLSPGDNTITVAVANGTDAKTYTVVVTTTALAEVSDDATLSALTLSDIDFDSFDPAVTSYTVNVADTVATTTLTAVPAVADAVPAILPADADTATVGHQIDVAEGVNTVKITVESTDGTDAKTYTLRLHRASADVFGWNPFRDAYFRSSFTRTGLWSDGTTAWVADRNNHRIYAFDLATGVRRAHRDISTRSATAADFFRQGRLGDLWSDGTTMWVSDTRYATIFAFDLATGVRRAHRDIAADTARESNRNPRGLWSDGTTMWVSDRFVEVIFAYDLATGARRPARDIANPHGYPIPDVTGGGRGGPFHDQSVSTYNADGGIWSDGVTMWATDDRGNRIYAFDLATGDRRADLDFGTLGAAGNHNPRGLWSDGVTMWVSDEHDAKVYAYNMVPVTALRSLELAGIDFGSFRSSRFDYAVSVPVTTTSTTVTAVPALADASVAISPPDADTGTVGYQVSLGLGENTITAAVTDGADTTTYTVVVTRTSHAVLSGDATLSSLALSDVGIGAFDAAVTGYTADVANSVASTTVVAVATVAGSEVTISPEDADAVAAGHQVALGEGANTVTVSVGSTDGIGAETYTVTVNRASAEDFGWKVLEDVDLAADNGSARAVWSDGATMWVSNIDGPVFAYELATMSRDSDKDITTLGGVGNLYPHGLWSDGTTMWASDDSADIVFAYDLATGERRAASDVGTLGPGAVGTLAVAGNGSSKGLWSDGVTMWVSDDDDDKVYAYVLATGDRDSDSDFDTLAAAGNNDPKGLWSDGVTMWAVDDDDDKVYAYVLATGDRDSDKDFDTLAAAGNHSPMGLWSDGVTMWVSDNQDDKIYTYNMPAGTAQQSQGTAKSQESGEQPTDQADVSTRSGRDAASADATPGTFLDFAPLAASNHRARAIWSDGVTMWVTDLNGSVFAYDLATMARDSAKDILTLPGAGNFRPRGLWSNGTTMWVSDDRDDKIYAYDLATGDRRADSDIDTLAAAGNNSPKGLWSDGTTMWAVDWSDEKAYAYDLATGARRESLDVTGLRAAGNRSPRGLWSNGDTMWVTDWRDKKIYAYDLATGARREGLDVDTLVAAGNNSPRGLWSNGDTMWVSDDSSDKIYTYNMPADPAEQPQEPVEQSQEPVQESQEPAGESQEPVQQSQEPAGESSGERRDGVAAVSDDATLSGLALSGVDIGAFNAAVTDYSAEVADSVTDATVAAVATAAGATVTISPDDADAAAEGHQVALAEGANTVTVSVASSDGTSTQTYTVTVNRASAEEFGWKVLEDIELAAGNGTARAIWSDGTTMWLTDLSGSVLAYELATMARDSDKDITALRDAGNLSPRGLWSDGTTMWTSDDGADKVHAYDLATGDRRPESDIDTLAAAGNNRSRGLWSNGTTMWVADWLNGRIYAYRLATGARDSDKDIGSLHGAGNGRAAGLWSDGTTMWVADELAAKIYAYDLATGDRRAALDFDTLAAAGNNRPAGLWSDGTTMWVTDNQDTKIYTYNMPARTAQRTQEPAQRTQEPAEESVEEFGRSALRDIELAAGNSASRAIWSDGTTMWVTDLGGSVFAYELATMSRDSAKDITALRGAGNLNANGLWSDGTTMWVSDDADDKIYAYDLATGDRRAASDIGTLAAAGNDSPKGLWSDGTTMWVSDWRDGKIYAYDLATGDRRAASDIGRLPSAGNGRAAGLWSNGTTMWVTDDRDAKIYAYDLATGDRRAALDFDTLAAAGNNSPKGLWSNGTTMWASDNQDAKVYAYNMPANALPQ